MAPSRVSPEQFAKVEERWNTLKEEETGRHRFVEELMATIQDLMHENKALYAQNKKLEFHESHYVAERDRLNQDCRTLKGRWEAGPFVAVLIDGDNSMFLDEFVRAGAEGGHRAAKKLREAIQTYSTTSLNFQAHWEVVVRIYVNQQGLKSAYARSRVASDAVVFENFLVGFNRELPLFEFVDVGSDKEAADNKIRANLSLYWKNEHCRHVMLAGSADAGYVTFLRQYCEESGLTTKLTLVESVPFPSSFQQLSAKFRNTKFENVLRNSKLDVAEQGSPPHNSSRQSYAFMTAGPASPDTENRAAPNSQFTQVTRLNRAWSRRTLFFNAHGQRIDEPLRPWEKYTEMDLRRRRLCPRHFLSQCNDTNCSKLHEGSINPEEEAALVRIARDDPCDKGTRCDDKRCVLAHNCPYDGHCTYGDDCKYGPEMHKIDKKRVTSC